MKLWLSPLLTLTLVFAMGPITRAEDSSSKQPIVPKPLSDLYRSKCSIITESDVKNFNYLLSEYDKKSAGQKDSAPCKSAMDKAAGFTDSLQNTLLKYQNDPTSDAANAEVNAGAESLQKSLSDVVRNCNSKSGKAQKVLSFAMMGLSASSYFGLPIGVARYLPKAKTVADGVKKASDVKNQTGFKHRLLTIAKGAGIIAGGGFAVSFLDKKEDKKKKQFLYKLNACQANQTLQVAAIEACGGNSTSTSDALRKSFSNIGRSAIETKTPGFCEQTACVWNNANLPSSKNWKNSSASILGINGPHTTDEAKDENNRIRDGLSSVSSWRSNCAHSGARCDVQCEQKKIDTANNDENSGAN